MRTIHLSTLDATALRFIARHRLIVRVGEVYRALSAPADAPGLPPDLIYRLRDKRLLDPSPVPGAFTIAPAGDQWLQHRGWRKRAA